MQNETPETIKAWSDATFGGDVSPLACAVRANLEMAELLAALTQNQSKEKVAEECADVCIVLWRLTLLVDFDLQDAINAKMQINRARKWQLDGAGCGFHVKDPA